MTVALPVLFRCVPLALRVSRASCGAAHLAENATPKKGERAKLNATCRDCAIGAAHARGETPTSWPDGAPIESAALSIGQPPGSRPLAPPPAPRRSRFELPPAIKRAAPPITATLPQPSAPEPSTMPRPKQITFKGKTLSESGWARELKMSGPALRGRVQRAIERGATQQAAWDEALSMPRDPSQPNHRDGKPKRPHVQPTLRDRIARGRAVSVDIDRAAIRELAKAIEGVPTKRTPPGAIASPAEALAAFGYRVASSIQTPAGLALIVEAP